jgi:hypothetical protein
MPKENAMLSSISVALLKPAKRKYYPLQREIMTTKELIPKITYSLSKIDVGIVKGGDQLKGKTRLMMNFPSVVSRKRVAPIFFA